MAALMWKTFQKSWMKWKKGRESIIIITKLSGITLDDNVENFPDLSHISGIKQKVGELDRVLFGRTGIPSLQKLQMIY